MHLFFSNFLKIKSKKKISPHIYQSQQKQEFFLFIFLTSGHILVNLLVNYHRISDTLTIHIHM
jgi:hypothetical protein